MQKRGSKITLRRSSTTSVSPQKERLMTERGKRSNSVSGASSPDSNLFVGFVTKCGGSVRSWKRRWMVLGRDGVIHYYPKPGAKPKGHLQLEPDDSAHAVKNSDRSDYMFAINTASRTFLMYPDSEEERTRWLECIRIAIDLVAVAAGRTPGPATAPRSLSGTPTTRSRGNSADDSSIDGSQVAQTLRASVMGMAFDALSVREQVERSSHHLEWFVQGDGMARRFHELWLRNLPYAWRTTSYRTRTVVEGMDEESMLEDDSAEGLDEEQENASPVRYRLAYGAEDDVAAWHASGPYELMVQGVVDYLYACGVGKVDFKMFSALCGLVRPVDVGLWMETRKDGVVLGGWSVDVPQDCDGSALVGTIGHSKLSAFFEAHRARVRIVQVARNCAEVEKSFVVVLQVRASHLEMLYNSLEGMMPLPLTVVKNIRLMGKEREGDYLSLHVSDDGSICAVVLQLPEGKRTGASVDHLSKLLRAQPDTAALRIDASSGSSMQLNLWTDTLQERAVEE